MRPLRPRASLHERRPLEALRVGDDAVGVGLEPLLEQPRVDAPEVRCRLEVAVLVERVQARELADLRPGGVRPDQEAAAGGAVVGPERRVLLDPAAELAEGQQDDPVGLPGGGQVVVERRDRVRQLGQEGGMGGELIGVGVEPAVGDVEQPGTEPRRDQVGDQCQVPRQLAVAVREAGREAGPVRRAALAPEDVS